MTPLLQFILFVLAVGLLAWPVGHWLAATVCTRRLDPLLEKLLGPGIHRTGGWKPYFLSLLSFNGLMFAVTWLVLANQQHLPLNPDGMKSVPWHLVFNTTASFVTNTNLQHYAGEATFSYFSQLTLMWLQFTSAATGIAAFLAVARGLSGSRDVGNFAHDAARILILFLLPLATIWAIAFVLAGVPMTMDGSATATTLEGATQTIARGPVAAFLAIKQLGTNGGGFFGTNSTHPFENPNLVANLLSMVAIPLIPMACVFTFGRLIGKPRHARVIGTVMLAFLLLKVVITVLPEAAPTAVFHDLPVAASANLEGKELRFGAATGPLWAVLTTSTSNGSVGAMHDSLNPLSLLGPFTGMWLNSTFGGVGVGMINFFLFMILAVFVAGLMVGRTPEYLGKKVEAREMALASAAFMVHPLLILLGTAIFAATPMGAATIHNGGARGFSEILYEFSSAAANNGSGLEGLGDATAAWNIVTGFVMLLGRYLPILLPLAIAASLAAKPKIAESSGTLRTDTTTFGVMVFAVILFLGALTFLPVALLGPVLEHLSASL
ncbi:MAG: potassium-transporting ATPase subunit KdpA [Verrucomicrobiota bacterium]